MTKLYRNNETCMNYSTYNSLNSNTNKDIQEIVSSYVHLLSILYYITLECISSQENPLRKVSFTSKKKRKEMEQKRVKIRYVLYKNLYYNTI